MPYVTGMKGNTVYWVEKERSLDLEIEGTKMEKIGLKNVNMWVVKPKFNNPYFMRQYPDCLEIEPLGDQNEESSN